MRKTLGILVLALAAGATIGGAQTPVTAGARVRVAVAPSRARRIATVVSATRDTLALRIDGTTRLVPVDSITRLEVSRGTHRNTLKGLLIGTGVGAATGVTIGLASGKDKEGFIRFSGGEKATMAGLALGAVGGVIGTVAGYATVHDDWVSVPTDRLRARIAGMPVRFGVMIRR